MSDTIDLKLAENLRRWQASGEPRRCYEAHRDANGNPNWGPLFASLRWSEFWPLEPTAVRQTLAPWLNEPNFRRWQASGQPDGWVADREGVWNHDDWLALLASLRQSDYWPLDPGAVGALLDRLGLERRNFGRWRDSGQPLRWVEERDGSWNHDDWLSLVEALRQSIFWPLCLRAVGTLLEELKLCHGNLRRWQASGQAYRWIGERQGQWDHTDWVSLLDTLKTTEFWPLHPDAMGRALDGLKVQWWNLHRWRASGLATAWVEKRQGVWHHADWLGLLDELHATNFAPYNTAALGELLEAVRTEWCNVVRWQHEGGPQRWLAERHGAWGPADIEALAASLERAGYGRLDRRAVDKVLATLAREQTNLRRWQASGQPRLWVEARRGSWDHGQWLALLDGLRASEYWPLAPEEIGGVLEQLKHPSEPKLARFGWVEENAERMRRRAA